MVYNPKLKDEGLKFDRSGHQSGIQGALSRTEQVLEGAAKSPVTKWDSLRFRMSPGRYTQQLVVICTADKKNQTLAHSIDFTVVTKHISGFTFHVISVPIRRC